MYVTLAEIKEHLKVEHNLEDTDLQALLDAAEAAVNTYCRQTFDAESVPKEIPLAVRMHVGYFYANREAANRVNLRSMYEAFNNLLYPLIDKDKML